MPVTCRLCGKEFGKIVPAHLKYKHNGMTVAEYQEMFPDAPLENRESKRKRQQSIKEHYNSPKYQETRAKQTTYTIVCPNCGETKTFEKNFPCSYERKFCTEGCASSYNNTIRWSDPQNRQRHSRICTEAWKDEQLRKKQGEDSAKRWADPIFKQKTKKIMLLAHRTPQARKNHSVAASKRWEDPKYQKHISQKTTESWADPNYRAKIQEAWTPEKRAKASERSKALAAERDMAGIAKESWAKRSVKKRKEAGKKISIAIKKLWQDSKWAYKALRSRHTRPTKPELALFKLLNTNGYGYVYAGDGSLWIGRKNPDFVWPERRLIVECYGAYWHSEDEVKPRIEHFANYGFRTLIIWDYELKNTKQLLTKLQKFHQG